MYICECKASIFGHTHILGDFILIIQRKNFKQLLAIVYRDFKECNVPAKKEKKKILIRIFQILPPIDNSANI